MWKRLLFRLFKRLAMWALKKAFHYADKNDDGQLSWDELRAFGNDAKNYGQKIIRRTF